MTTQKLYQKTLNEQMTQNEFLWNVRRDPTYASILTNTMSYEDTVKTLKAKGFIWDSSADSSVKAFDFLGTFKALNEADSKKQKLKGGKGDKLSPDRVNYHEFQKGWKHELEHTDDIDKAKEIALDHLAEDPMYYTRLEMIEYKSKKKNRTDLPVEVKKENFKDEANQMEKVKKITSSRSGSVKTEKIEEPKKNVGNKKHRPKKIKVKKMKGGSGEMTSKQLKEASESENKVEFTGPGEYYIQYTKKENLGKSGISPRGSKIKISDKEDFKRIQNTVSSQDNVIVSFVKVKDANTSSDSNKSSAPKDPLFKVKIKIGDKWMDANLTDKEIESREKKGIEVKKVSDTAVNRPSQSSASSVEKVRNLVKRDVDSKGVKRAPVDPRSAKQNYPFFIEDLKNKKILYGVESEKRGREDIDSLPDPKNYRLISAVAAKAKGYLNEAESVIDKIKNYISSSVKSMSLKGKEVAFQVPGSGKDVDSLENVTDKISSVKTKENLLDIKLEGGGNIIFKIGDNNFMTPVYNKGSEVKRVKNVGESLQKILDELFPVQKSEETVLEEYIRKRIKKAIEEAGEYNYLGLEGPEVKKKHLEDYMKRYEWGWQDVTDDPAKKDRGNQIHSIASKYVVELGEPGIAIFNKYAPEKYQIKNLEDLGKYGADQVTGVPSMGNYNPDKLTSRSGRVAEEKSEEEIIKNAKRYNNTDSPEFKTALKDLQSLIAKYNSQDKDLPKNVTDALKQMSDLIDLKDS